MKKIISIILAAMLTLSVFCVSSFAADTKTETLINQLVETKSISIDFSDENFENIGYNISSVKASAKIYEKDDGSRYVKAVVTGKLQGIDFKLYVNDEKIKVYIPLLRICLNISEFIDIKPIINDVLGELDKYLDMTESDYAGYAKLASAGEKDVEGYGTVYVESFVPDVKAIAEKAVSDGNLQLPEGVNLEEMTEEEIKEYLASVDPYLAAVADSSFDFYYRDDKLVGLKGTFVDENGEANTIDSSNEIKINSITSGVDDKEFKAPSFYIDITGFVKLILRFIAG
ncbi:MAG: hypothetical protein ACI4I3_05150 [Acutalibacteraceae bacterium]